MMAPRTPSYPVYTQPSRPSAPDTYDSYEAEKKKLAAKSTSLGRKGMQLGKKSKTTDIYEKVRGDFGHEAEKTPLVSAPPTSSVPAADKTSSPHVPPATDRDPIHVTVSETISAKLSREGALKSFEVKGDLQLRISDPSFTKIKLDLTANPTHGAQFRTHPNVDKALFTNEKAIQLKDTSKRFPVNNSIGVLRWRVAGSDNTDILPITFTVWVNRGSESTTVTVEYELTGSDIIEDVIVTIPFGAVEPTVTSFDAIYEVTGDSIDWNIGHVGNSNPSGSFEFESSDSNGDENEFFPMSVKFNKSTPFVEVAVLAVSLLEMGGEDVSFSKDVRSIADGYLIE